jgi:hypothetical protein
MNIIAIKPSCGHYTPSVERNTLCFTDVPFSTDARLSNDGGPEEDGMIRLTELRNEER